MVDFILGAVAGAVLAVLSPYVYAKVKAGIAALKAKFAK